MGSKLRWHRENTRPYFIKDGYFFMEVKVMKRKVALAQMDIQLGLPEANYQKAARAIKAAADHHADIIVLPEMWNTGYALNKLKDIADNNGQKTQQFLSKLALENKINIVGGSVAIRRGTSFYNTSYIYDQTGQLIGTYDKVHLFGLMDENQYLKAGVKESHFALAGIPSASFICYDLRFPEWVRTTARHGADILYFPAEWPSSRIKQWKIMLQSRAIENQAFVVAVNRVGTDLDNDFNGHSLVIDPLGNIISDAGEDERVSYAEVDLGKLAEVRGPIPVFKDRRPELYH